MPTFVSEGPSALADPGNTGSGDNSGDPTLDDQAPVDDATLDDGTEIGDTVDETELDSTEIDSTEIDSTEIDSTEIDSTEIDSTEIDSTEIDSTETDSTEIESTEVQEGSGGQVNSDSTLADEICEVLTEEAGELISENAARAATVVGTGLTAIATGIAVAGYVASQEGDDVSVHEQPLPLDNTQDESEGSDQARVGDDHAAHTIQDDSGPMCSDEESFLSAGLTGDEG